jgi:RNA polymerase sigma-70 factor (ECF subfamily)
VPTPEELEEIRDDFSAFYRTTETGLRAYVLRSVASKSLADDIVQETFVRLLASNRARLAHHDRKLYLFRIASNLLRDHWAADRRTAQLDSEEFLAGAPHPVSGQVTDLMRAFEKLPPKYRSLLWLAYVEEYDHKEIAQTLQVNRLSVKVMLSRGRKMLAGSMEGKAL